MKYKKIHLTVISIGTIFIFLGLFHTNIWFNEAFSIELCKYSFKDIWKITGYDSHPVLYYYLLHIIYLIIGKNILIFRLFSAIPICILGTIGFTHIRKDFGEKCGIVFSILTYFLPISVVYSNEIRMYSWSALIVTILSIYAYRIYKEKCNKNNFIIFIIFCIFAMYIHYYGLILVIIENIALLIIFIRNRDIATIKKIICMNILMLIIYLPWIYYIKIQISDFSNITWIQNEFKYSKSLVELVSYPFIGNFQLYLGAAISVLIYAYCIGKLIFLRINKIKLTPVIISIVIYISTILISLMISLCLGHLILYYRYLFVLIGLLIFFISYIISKESNKYVFGGILIFIILIGIFNNLLMIYDNYNIDNTRPIDTIKNNIQSSDIFVYNNIRRASVISTNFTENKHFFYNYEHINIEQAYKTFLPQMETIRSLDCLKNFKGRIWIIDNVNNDFYNEFFNNKQYKLIFNETFYTSYKYNIYNINLLEKIY